MAARSCFSIPRHRVLAASLSAALAVIACPHETHGAVLPVTSCADDGSPGTLRSVMYSAQDFDVVDLTQLTCSTITLTQGVIDTSWEGYYALDYLTLIGPGRQLIISGGNASPVLTVGGTNWNGYFSLSDITIADGWNAIGKPGCINSIRGALILSRVTADNCHAQSYPAPHGPYISEPAGAIRAQSLFATQISVTDSSYTAFYQNVASGGGIWVGGLGVVIDSIISGNSTTAIHGYNDAVFESTGGGGIYSAGDLYVIGSTVSGNTVEATNPGENGRGGGIFVRGSLVVLGSTVSGNTVDGDGGGLYKFGYPDLVDFGTTLTIQNSTIAGNVAGGAGAGFVSQRPTWLDNSTIAGNSSGAGAAAMFRYREKLGYRTNLLVGVQSTIIGANTAGPNPTYATDLAADDVLTVTGSHSLIMDAAPDIALPLDTLYSDPLLLPLADNGGLVWTMALAPGSPAIDTGSNPLGLQTDQRGSPWLRTFGAAPDIGAYEVQPPPDPIFANGFDP